MNTTLAEIAALVGGKVLGDSSVRITGLNGIREARESELTFIADSRYLPYLNATSAAAVVVSKDIAEAPLPLIQVDDPRHAMLAILLAEERELERRPEGRHPTAVVGKKVRLGQEVALGAHAVVEDDTELGDGVVLYAGVYIGVGCTIGPKTVLYPNATIRDRVRIGARCIIHSGVVLGSDGFGFAEQNGRQVKIPQVGTVQIGDDVEIGANSAVDRATFGATVIGDGSKIDNLVQIGHNVRIGRNCIVCGKAGIAGSTVLGDNVTIGAAAGIAGHIDIGDGAVVAAYSGVTKSLPPGTTVLGFPAVEIGRARRMQAGLRQLPEALRRLKALEHTYEHVEGQLHGTPEDDC